MRGVDLEVRPGERRAVLGPNGAGKTTVFNLISGEFPPSSGRVELFGQDVTNLPARKRARLGLSRTFQTSRLFAGLSVEDNLYLGALGVAAGHLRMVPSGKDDVLREKARAMSAQVGLEERLGDFVADLSHGEQRQLEVGMALVAEPRLVDARRAGRRPLARGARAADGDADRPRRVDHAGPDRARHGRRAARRQVGDDDA